LNRGGGTLFLVETFFPQVRAFAARRGRKGRLLLKGGASSWFSQKVCSFWVSLEEEKKIETPLNKEKRREGLSKEVFSRGKDSCMLCLGGTMLTPCHRG